MTLYQPESGYSYNSDSLFLYDFISRFNPKGELLDVGAGCGIVGLLLARDFTKVRLSAVEKQELFIKYAKKNALINEIEYRLFESNFLELEEENKYDFIVSNPPFYPDGVQKSEDAVLLNARYASNLPLDLFFTKVSKLLKPHSHFIFCYDPSSFGDICSAIVKVKMRICDVQFVHSKEEKNASLVMVHARNGSKSMMKILEPLIVMRENEYTQITKNIFIKTDTKSIKCQL
ncbi:tRNA (adenine37-N(6))-methyltransferase TrmN6 [hydrothermal vent metagenome]|uniref:tRNA (Adenine37-N(6))-methyltransferase TrmN6 n=1 Tax=hydrothermal vent metagenome TaxID=652676 RepID=A0A1W1CJE8_9ZZZZ